MTLLPSVRQQRFGHRARKTCYTCLNSVGLLKLSRGNVESCYFSKASDQGQLGELVAKLCYREDKSYIWLGFLKKAMLSGFQC